MLCLVAGRVQRHPGEFLAGHRHLRRDGLHLAVRIERARHGRIDMQSSRPEFSPIAKRLAVGAARDGELGPHATHREIARQTTLGFRHPVVERGHGEVTVASIWLRSALEPFTVMRLLPEDTRKSPTSFDGAANSTSPSPAIGRPRNLPESVAICSDPRGPASASTPRVCASMFNRPGHPASRAPGLKSLAFA